jgi:DNA/RNA-binding protein KIN17
MIDSQILAAGEKKRKFNDENGINDNDDDDNNNNNNELIREEGSSLKIGLSMTNKNTSVNKIKKNSFFDDSDDIKIEEKVNNNNNISVIEKLMQEDQKKIINLRENEDKKNRKDYWLHTNIVVKIINKKLSDGKFYKKKGVVCSISDKYIGEVRLSDGTRIRLDQEHLETVLPKVFILLIYIIY